MQWNEGGFSQATYLSIFLIFYHFHMDLPPSLTNSLLGEKTCNVAHIVCCIQDVHGVLKIYYINLGRIKALKKYSKVLFCWYSTFFPYSLTAKTLLILLFI